MQFTISLASALMVLQFVAAQKTVYVTQTLFTTILPGQSEPTTVAAPVAVQVESPKVETEVATDSPATSPKVETEAAPSPAVAETTQTPAKKEPAATTTATTAAASTQTSGSSDSGIYADISKSSNLDASFAKAILDAHNEKRALHSAPNLSWDKTVYEYAQAYADKYDCSGGLTHSGGKYGENLAVGYANGPAALDAWYSEGSNYDYSSLTAYDHFTQVVWKSTTKLGCAIKDCSANNWGHYVICSYDPAGNMMGAQTKNVFPN
ncbi:protein Pry1p [[Candida] anglica]|uniref:Protein Pry1p n=1 Tax=[Candida] anglica TaxID=148631 RepID=A0ABP0EGP6_9ASCO